MYYYLTRIALYQEDLTEAIKNNDILFSLRIKYKNPNYYDLQYQFTKALILKSNGEMDELAKSEKILKDILDKNTGSPQIIYEVMYYLCELLIQKYQTTQNPSHFGELNIISREIIEYSKNDELIGLRLKGYNIRLLVMFVQNQINPGSVNAHEVDSLILKTQELTDKYGLYSTNVQFTQQYFELVNFKF